MKTTKIPDLPDHIRKQMMSNARQNYAHVSLILASGGLDDETYETLKSHETSLSKLIDLLETR